MPPTSPPPRRSLRRHGAIAWTAVLVGIAGATAGFATPPSPDRETGRRYDLRLEALSLRDDGTYVADLLILPATLREGVPLDDQALAAPRVAFPPGAPVVVSTRSEGLELRSTLEIDGTGRGTARLEVVENGRTVEEHRLLFTDLEDPPYAAASAGAGRGPADPRRPEPISLALEDAAVGDALAAFARVTRRRLEVSGPVHGTVSIAFENVPWTEALDAIAAEAGFTWRAETDRLIVTFAAAP